MRRHYALTAAALLMAAAACSDQSPTALTAPPGHAAREVWSVDADQDGIDDGTEWELANRYAPVLYMPNLISRDEATYINRGDWTWPATVEWYLPQVRMRMHHGGCDDHGILDFGQVTDANIANRSHKSAQGLGLCWHSSEVNSSGSSFHYDDHFFLQAGNDAVVHPGIHDSSQWKAYFHAYRNAEGGISIQYWFFYAFDDGILGQNHEGDWEHVDVRLDATGVMDRVYYSAHHDLNAFDPAVLSLWNGTHPQVWVADGTHANYPSHLACNTALIEGALQSCWNNDMQRWFTWGGATPGESGLHGLGLVNMGEKAHPMPGQNWVAYSGTWGEVGAFAFANTDMSGPRGPAYQASWKTDFPYVSGTASVPDECPVGNTLYFELQEPC